MKKLNLAIVLALGVVIPFGAMGAETDNDNEVTIRMMNMYENSTDKVTKQIALPDMASDQAALEAKKTERHRVRVMNRENSDEVVETPPDDHDAFGNSYGEMGGADEAPGGPHNDGAGPPENEVEQEFEPGPVEEQHEAGNEVENEAAEQQGQGNEGSDNSPSGPGGPEGK